MPATRGIVPVHDRESAAADRRFGGAGPPASTYLPAGVASAGAGLAFGLAARVALELGRLTGTAGSVGFSATHSLLGAVGSAEAACRSSGLLHPASASSAAVAAVSGIGRRQIMAKLLQLDDAILAARAHRVSDRYQICHVISKRAAALRVRGDKVDSVDAQYALLNRTKSTERRGIPAKSCPCAGWKKAAQGAGIDDLEEQPGF